MSCLLYESKGVGFPCVTTVQRSTDMEGEKWVGGGGGGGNSAPSLGRIQDSSL